MSADEASDCPLFVTLRVPDQSLIQHVIGLYDSADADVETVTIADPCSDGTHPVVVDLGTITEKQWEALEMAYALDHYSGRRGGNLDEIADELGISKSAVSQRLRAAEARIVEGVLGTGRLQCGDAGDTVDIEDVMPD